jgi:glycosyltransferase involved in cell wall biosynthesis
MIKIAYILTPIEFGGSEKVNLLFLKNVNKNKFDIQPVLLVRPWENANLFITEIISLGFSPKIIPVALKPLDQGKDYLRILRCFKFSYKILSNNNFNIVHSHGYFADIISLPFSKILKIPQISTCHGFLKNNRTFKLYNFIDKLFLKLFCNQIISVSEELKNELIKNKINESRITVIQNAVQPINNSNEYMVNRIPMRKHLSIRDDTFIVGYIGRLSEEKGIVYLIKAIKIIEENHKDIKLFIIGEGPQRSILEGFVKSNKLESNVFFTGFQSNIYEWLAALDIFVLPSLTEGTPMALLEAMAAGVPVIASAVGGVPSVIDNGLNGFLITPKNSIELSEKILSLLNDSKLRETFSIEGKNKINKLFNIKDWCKKIEHQYDMILRS